MFRWLLLLLTACAPLHHIDLSVQCEAGIARGIPVSPNHVLVADHVVQTCGGWIAVGNAVGHLAEVNGDVALIVLDYGFNRRYVVETTEPSSHICATVGRPRKLTCVKIERIAEDYVDANLGAVAGDSGTGVYDIGGKLVGIISARTSDGLTRAYTRKVWGPMIAKLPKVSLE